MFKRGEKMRELKSIKWDGHGKEFRIEIERKEATEIIYCKGDLFKILRQLVKQLNEAIEKGYYTVEARGQILHVLISGDRND